MYSSGAFTNSTEKSCWCIGGTQLQVLKLLTTSRLVLYAYVSLDAIAQVAVRREILMGMYFRWADQGCFQHAIITWLFSME